LAIKDPGYIHICRISGVLGGPLAALYQSGFQLLNEGHSEKQIPPGELMELLIEALLYTGVEAHRRGNNDMTCDCATGLSLLETTCLTDSLNPSIEPTVKLSANPASLSALPGPRYASILEPLTRYRSARRARLSQKKVNRISDRERTSPITSKLRTKTLTGRRRYFNE